MDKNTKKWIYLFLLSGIWGSSYILIKKGLIGLSPIQLACFRIVITSFILVFFGLRHVKNLNRDQWKWLSVTGFFGTFFPTFLFAYSETKIDSSVVAVLNGLTPLFTLFIALLFFRYTFKKLQFFGVAVGLLGTVMLIYDEYSSKSFSNANYSLLVLIASLCYGFNVNILKYKLKGVSSIGIAIGNFLAITPPALILLILSDFSWNTFYKKEEVITSLLFVFILASMGTALAKVMFNELVAISSPVFSVSTTYLLPIVAIGWGILDGESFGINKFISAFIILIGIYLITLKKLKN
tara:strand:+ start:1096 stop:1980 length:885 start_codon:yes stop_codon:yes gene_type:complete